MYASASSEGVWGLPRKFLKNEYHFGLSEAILGIEIRESWNQQVTLRSDTKMQLPYRLPPQSCVRQTIFRPAWDNWEGAPPVATCHPEYTPKLGPYIRCGKFRERCTCVDWKRVKCESFAASSTNNHELWMILKCSTGKYKQLLKELRNLFPISDLHFSRIYSIRKLARQYVTNYKIGPQRVALNGLY